jgi:agmatinase
LCPVYISIDLDVLDCAVAPAVGVPVPGGLYSGELFDILSVLSNLNVVGCDLVEYVPSYDRTEQTGILAAYLLQALLICMASNKCCKEFQ